MSLLVLFIYRRAKEVTKIKAGTTSCSSLYSALYYFLDLILPVHFLYPPFNM